VFQYGHSESLARAVLLLKDASVALLVLFSLAVTWRSLKLRWFDYVAIAYVVVVAIYSTSLASGLTSDDNGRGFLRTPVRDPLRPTLSAAGLPAAPT